MDLTASLPEYEYCPNHFRSIFYPAGGISSFPLPCNFPIFFSARLRSLIRVLKKKTSVEFKVACLRSRAWKNIRYFRRCGLYRSGFWLFFLSFSYLVIVRGWVLQSCASCRKTCEIVSLRGPLCLSNFFFTFWSTDAIFPILTLESLRLRDWNGHFTGQWRYKTVKMILNSLNKLPWLLSIYNFKQNSYDY